jgi:hypothetical protein
VTDTPTLKLFALCHALLDDAPAVHVAYTGVVVVQMSYVI